MWMYVLNRRLAFLIRPYWRLGIHGEVDAIPERGGLLLAANHSSYLDPWLIGMSFPRLPVRYLITEVWFHRGPAWNALFRAFGTIPTASTPRATIDAVCDAVGNGDVVGIFPEGRISLDGELQKFRSGLARMAARSGVPVLPIGIRGAFRSLPKHRKLPRPTRVEIHVGRPVTFEQVTGTREATLAAIATFNQDVRSRVLGLRDGRPPSG